jgi:hypothetical protein
MKFFRMVYLNLTRNRRRTLLTILSIAVSMFIFAALFTLPSFVDSDACRERDQPTPGVSGKAGLGYSLPELYGRRIAAIPHVVGVDLWNWFGGIYHLPSDQFPNLATEPNQTETVWPDWRVHGKASMHFSTSVWQRWSVSPPCNASGSIWASRSCCTIRFMAGTCSSKSWERWARARCPRC